MDLVSRILNEDVAHFEELMREYRGVVCRAASALLPDETVAADVIEDAFVAAYANLPKFRQGDRLELWLVELAVNEALSARRQGRGGRAALDDERACELLSPRFCRVARNVMWRITATPA